MFQPFAAGVSPSLLLQDLLNCASLTADGVAALAPQLPRLEHLGLEGCVQIGRQGILQVLEAFAAAWASTAEGRVHSNTASPIVTQLKALYKHRCASRNSFFFFFFFFFFFYLLQVGAAGFRFCVVWVACG